jgi:hypothetical protein
LPGPQFQTTKPTVAVVFSATVNPAEALRAWAKRAGKN